MKPLNYMTMALIGSVALFPLVTTADTTPSAAVRSETTAAKAPEAGEYKAATIVLRNVRPSRMAYWVDRANQPVPKEFAVEPWKQKSSRQPTDSAKSPLARNAPATRNHTGGAGFQLPEGVEKIVAVDAKNVLMIYGTESGIRELRSIVEILDRPVQLIELTARYIEVERGSSKGVYEALGINYSMSNGPFAKSDKTPDGTFSVGFIGDVSKLEDALQRGLVRQLGSTQSVIPNNLPASSTLLTISASNSPNTFPLPLSIETHVTPTVNADDTITLMLSPKLRIERDQGGFSEQSIQSVVNIRDGDTVALGGLRGAGGSDLILVFKARKLPLPKVAEVAK